MKNTYVEIISFLIDNLIGENKYKIDVEYLKNKQIIELKIDNSNIGKVIGKNGKIITSIRNLINSISNKEKINVEIKVLEE